MHLFPTLYLINLFAIRSNIVIFTQRSKFPTLVSLLDAIIHHFFFALLRVLQLTAADVITNHHSIIFRSIIMGFLYKYFVFVTIFSCCRFPTDLLSILWDDNFLGLRSGRFQLEVFNLSVY